MRTKLYDPNFRGRISYKVVQEPENAGILFTYYVRFQDSLGNIVEESLIPIFIDLNGNAIYDLNENYKIFRTKSERLNVSTERVENLFKGIWEKLKETSDEVLNHHFVPNKKNKFEELAKKVAEKRKKDIESWLQGEEKYIRKEIGQLQQEFKLNKTGTIDDFLHSPKEDPETLLNRKIAYKERQIEKKKLEAEERLIEVENLLKIDMSKEILLGVLFIIPQNIIDKR